jgi:hypothetical protein
MTVQNTVHVGTAHATTTVVNHDPAALTAHIDPVSGPDAQLFALSSGNVTVPGNGQLPVTVRYLGAEDPGLYGTSIRIVVAGHEFTVPVTATVTQVGPHP